MLSLNAKIENVCWIQSHVLFQISIRYHAHGISTKWWGSVFNLGSTTEPGCWHSTVTSCEWAITNSLLCWRSVLRRTGYLHLPRAHPWVIGCFSMNGASVCSPNDYELLSLSLNCTLARYPYTDWDTLPHRLLQSSMASVLRTAYTFGGQALVPMHMDFMILQKARVVISIMDPKLQQK